jgi:hypothetical protein
LDRAYMRVCETLWVDRHTGRVLGTDVLRNWVLTDKVNGFVLVAIGV